MNKSQITKWFKPNFDVEDTIKKSSNDHSTGIPVKNKSSKKYECKKPILKTKANANLNLLDKLSPEKVSDLAVHPKKLTEIESWLTQNVLPSNKVSALLLTGPTGAGKTAAAHVLCKSMNIKIIEWINSLDIDIEEVRGPGQTVRFTEFLIQSSRYPSLLTSTATAKKIILVEDFPNSIVHNPSEFEGILELLFNKGKSSVIFICTESKDNNLNLAQHLFPDNLKNKFGITTISFNPVSVTHLKNALKRATTIIADKYSDIYQIPSQDTIDSIINSAMGDVRCAINYFNFACLKGSVDLPINIQITQKSGSKRKRKEKDKGTLSNMNRDESLGLLHGVGRVLYPKRVQLESSWRLERQPETIVDQFITIPSLFVSFLHENYLRYFGSFPDVCQASEILSFAELLMTDWRERDHIMKYGLWIAIMGLMVKNANAVTRWNPVQGPKHLKHKNNVKMFENERLDPIDASYYDIIMPPGYSSSSNQSVRFVSK